MVEPSLDQLLKKVDSKYTLVTASSKRARKIMEECENSLENPVSLALREIAENKVSWVRNANIVEEDSHD
ncbi:MAG TPA: DNA-directed RNA polymerase subunit omega [Clostridiales bacterium]|nr:DNA-directed RNA polymerase subunit omega [Clostridiales bacterium]